MTATEPKGTPHSLLLQFILWSVWGIEDVGLALVGTESVWKWIVGSWWAGLGKAGQARMSCRSRAILLNHQGLM